jgi:HSP20 family protein
MDQMLEPSSLAPGNGGGEYSLALDVSENEEQFTVVAAVPGVSPADLEITLTDNVLTIRGELRQEQEREQERVHLRERRYGRFVRSLTLPVPVQDEQIEAHYEQGVLTLRLPKAEQAKPKRIDIKSQGQISA